MDGNKLPEYAIVIALWGRGWGREAGRTGMPVRWNTILFSTQEPVKYLHFTFPIELHEVLQGMSPANKEFH